MVKDTLFIVISCVLFASVGLANHNPALGPHPNNPAAGGDDSLATWDLFYARSKKKKRLDAEPLQKSLESGESHFLRNWIVPGLTFGSPAGFGADRGHVFGGVAGVPENEDLIPYLGVGIGNSRKYVGLSAAITIYDVASNNPRRITLAEGGLSLKLHHYFTRIGLAVSVGMENVFDWGPVKGFQTTYLAVSKFFRLRDDFWFSSLVLTSGLGNGRFKGSSDILNNKESVNVFGALAFRVALPVSLLLDWTGRALNIGISVTPFQRFPIFLTAGVGNVFEGSKLPMDRLGRYSLFAISFNLNVF